MRIRNVAAEEEPLPLPVMNFGKDNVYNQNDEDSLPMPIMNFGGAKQDKPKDNTGQNHPALLSTDYEIVDDAGAGFFLLNADGTKEIGYEALRNFLASALREKDKESFIVEVFDSYFIFESSGMSYKQKYSLDEDKSSVKFEGLPEQVIKSVEYETTENNILPLPAMNFKKQHSQDIEQGQESLSLPAMQF